MPWKLGIAEGVLEVVFQGTFQAEELRECTLAIVDTAIQSGVLLILLDCHDTHFNVPTVAVYQLPELYDAKGLSRKVRAAVVKPQDGYHMEIFEFYEDVCRNRGYFVALFDDAMAAREWLLGDDPTTHRVDPL